MIQKQEASKQRKAQQAAPSLEFVRLAFGTFSKAGPTAYLALLEPTCSPQRAAWWSISLSARRTRPRRAVARGASRLFRRSWLGRRTVRLRRVLRQPLSTRAGTKAQGGGGDASNMSQDRVRFWHGQHRVLRESAKKNAPKGEGVLEDSLSEH